MPRLSPALLALSFAAACGPPIRDREDAAVALAHAALPSPHAQQVSGAVIASGADTLPQPTLRVAGPHGGEARLEFNLVSGAVGLIGEGLLFNVHFADYSADGHLRLDGDVAVLANFHYVAESDPYADLKLTLAGRVRVSGVFHDELHARISLITRLSELQLRGEALTARLDGYVEGSGARFDFQEEDLALLWARFSAPPGAP